MPINAFSPAHLTPIYRLESSISTMSPSRSSANGLGLERSSPTSLKDSPRQVWPCSHSMWCLPSRTAVPPLRRWSSGPRRWRCSRCGRALPFFQITTTSLRRPSRERRSSPDLSSPIVIPRGCPNQRRPLPSPATTRSPFCQPSEGQVQILKNSRKLLQVTVRLTQSQNWTR